MESTKNCHPHHYPKNRISYNEGLNFILEKGRSSLWVQGFTIVELLITMIIIGMLGGLAVAGYQSQLKTQRADNALTDFMVFLQSARSAAIIQRTEVVLCPAAWSPSFATTLVANTATHCGARNSWNRGAVAFTDHNRDLQINGEDKVIGLLPRDYAGIEITWRAFRNRSYLRFNKNGLTDWQNGRFIFCSNSLDPEARRQITINSAGRIYPSYDNDTDGIHEDSNGRNIVCP